MKVYIVTADTYDGVWGSEIRFFGVFTTPEKAEERKDDLLKNGYRASVNEVPLDEICKIYLGGYIE